ncbi:DNA primase [Marinivivus vitaminiproducens]|uniref:DNA primase n=1 Tax=Marinivivus vitaminiproducens TaxID=3035935 RepID=UPI00279ED8F1|nr:DNA primase [Geminicoccaceae bacterium SCSIO 64248]
MARDDAAGLDAFKARLPIADVVGRFVRLTRRGREHVGLCPFHKEKTPSFTVAGDKGFFHCFGCGASGNAIDFVMKLEGLEFRDAVLRLADLTGIEAPQLGARVEGQRVDDALYRANHAAATWFTGRLRSPEGEGAVRYLAGRGVSEGATVRFGLGYAPERRDALKRALMAEGFTEAQLIEAGLLIAPEDGGASFDRFRHRLMFPIHDRRGRVVAFGGRALGEARAKYLNSPDTQLFHKGELLYNLANARQPARAAGTVLVVEGYMDVIACAEAGLAHAVAPLGTALTDGQLGLLWQLTEEPVICLDGDAAGLRAAGRVAEKALPMLQAGRSVRFALLPQGEDPDSLVRGQGAGALDAVVAKAMPLVDFLWQQALRERPCGTPEQKAGFERHLRNLIQTIADASVRSHYYDELVSRRFRSMFRSGRGRPASGDLKSTLRIRAVRRSEAPLLRPFVLDPDLLNEVEDEVASLEFSDPDLDKLRLDLLAWKTSQVGLDVRSLHDHLRSSGNAMIVNEMLGERSSFSAGREAVLAEWRDALLQYERSRTRRLAGSEMAQAIEERWSDQELATMRLAQDRIINRNDGSA